MHLSTSDHQCGSRNGQSTDDLAFLTDFLSRFGETFAAASDISKILKILHILNTKRLSFAYISDKSGGSDTRCQKTKQDVPPSLNAALNTSSRAMPPELATINLRKKLILLNSKSQPEMSYPLLLNHHVKGDSLRTALIERRGQRFFSQHLTYY